MRTVLAVVVAAAALAAPASAAAAPSTRSCPQSDPDNGLRSLRAAGVSCSHAFGVAKRTNSVKCFLNGNSCVHTYRDRRWRCRLNDPRVTCTSTGGRVVKYRLG
jgi:hypothetical protein